MEVELVVTKDALNLNIVYIYIYIYIYLFDKSVVINTSMYQFNCLIRLMSWAGNCKIERLKVMRYFGLNHRPSYSVKLKLKELRSLLH